MPGPREWSPRGILEKKRLSFHGLEIESEFFPGPPPIEKFFKNKGLVTYSVVATAPDGTEYWLHAPVLEETAFFREIGHLDAMEFLLMDMTYLLDHPKGYEKDLKGKIPAARRSTMQLLRRAKKFKFKDLADALMQITEEIWKKKGLDTEEKRLRDMAVKEKIRRSL